MRSREEDVIGLFFNSAKRWRFGEMLRKTRISRGQLACWLARFEEEGLVLHVREEGKHPYYIHNFQDPRFRNRKRLYALQKLTRSGLLDHLAGLDDARVVILFGSFSRADWYGDSDIDIFIYGKDDAFEKGVFERRLKREIQVFTAADRRELRKFSGMLPAIIGGDFIKGSIREMGVDVRAEA